MSPSNAPRIPKVRRLRTVAEVRAHLAGAYNIAPEATVHVHGVEAGEDTRLRAGDCLEFVRAAGEKGGV